MSVVDISSSKRSMRVAAGGVVIVVLALAADLIGLSSSPGIGGVQLVLLAVGSAVAAWGASHRWPRLRAALTRTYVLLGSLYFALWIVEVMLAYPLNPRRGFKVPVASLEGLYEVGDQVSYRHAAGFTGTFDDGIVQAPVSINSRGDRDREPRDEHPEEHRVLLIGDSQTWGYGLPADQTIDAQIEVSSEGTLDAYNLGVMGYGPGDTYLRYREADWWRGRTVIYMFFLNDLQDNNAQPGLLTAFQGYPVPRYRDDGEEYTEQEWAELLAKVLETGDTGGQKDQFALTFTLGRLRQIVRQASSPTAKLTGGFSDEIFSDANVDSALIYTGKMRALAEERGARFVVAIMPAVGEAAADEYCRWVAAYVAQAKASGFEVLELYDVLDRSHYFGHDPHFNAEGTHAIAAKVVDHLGRE